MLMARAPVFSFLRASSSGPAGAALKPQSFFFSSVSGVIFYADDLGNSPDTGINVGASVNVMQYYEAKKRLVVVTATLMMTQIEVRRVSLRTCTALCWCIVG